MWALKLLLVLSADPRIVPGASRKQGSIGAELLWLSLTGFGKSMLLLRLV